MLIVRRLRELLRDTQNIPAYDGLKFPKITQPYTRLILVPIFYCVYFRHLLFPMWLKNDRINLLAQIICNPFISVVWERDVLKSTGYHFENFCECIRL